MSADDARDLPRAAGPDDARDLPRAVLHEPQDAEVRLMRGLQAVALQHPIAAQAAISALIAEGRRFARTPEGRRWRDALVHSSLLHRARLAWETTTLVMLQEDPPEWLPSAYLDALFMLASSRDLEPLLDDLFRETLADAEDA